MKRISIIILCLFSFIYGFSQITNAEYFIDTDPGIGAGMPLTVSGNTIDQNFNIPTTGLSSGIHKLYIRVRDAGGDWSVYDKNVFYINPNQNNSASITAAEYFIDTDPGIGSGTALTMTGNVIDQNYNIPTTGLSDGIHKLYVRVINADGTWSIYDKNVFYINPNNSNSATISKAEYFIDTDPGIGNGTDLAMTGTSIDQNYSIPTTGLSDGIHKLYVRAINTDGTWSIYDKNVFYINPNQTNTSAIAKAEYFIDTDLGIGNGTDLTMTGNVIDQNYSIPTTGLSNGIHKLYVRVINDDGTWSIYDKNVFYINPDHTNSALITEAEYFIDTDPGVGNGTTLNLSGNIVDELRDIPTTGLVEGTYKLFVRVKNAGNTWSLYNGQDFTIGPADADNDSILDVDDNCIDTANADQADTDSDTVGDVCDNCPDDANTDQADADADTVGDICDTCPGFDDTVDNDSDGFPEGCDCDDTNAGINDDATDIPDNNIDEDCDGADLKTWYQDFDSDGYGNPNMSQTTNTQPTGYVSDNTDCDDTEAAAYPGNTEICDGIDNDCDGQVDEGVLSTFYADTDSDGYGDANTSIQACSAPTGYVTDNTDCDDTESEAYPGNTEVCDGIDNDCDGQVDEGVLSTFYADADSDGYGNPNDSIQACSAPIGYVSDNTDCDDTQAAAYPGNIEICDGIDNNCDGQVDEGVLSTFYADTDGDGYGDVNVTTQACSAPTGYVSDNTDCDDTQAAAYPGNTEVCDGIDNNCDGQVDEGVLSTFYADTDGDSYGDVNVTTQACTAPDGYVADNTDCDDTEAASNPGNTEVCDGIDNDCDGEIDEGVLSTFYADSDGDGYGDINMTTQACSAPSGYVDDNSDCDDTSASVYPEAQEIPNDGIDQDCNGSDLVIPDTDSDGILDNVDNCIDTPNPDQKDSDNDGIGDACDVMGIVVPKGFSPNGDGTNDTWMIENITAYPRNNIKVFNRWGNKVYESNNYQNNWNGESKEGGSGKLPVGPYLYIIELNEPGFSPVQGWMYINY
ncbi:MopE-related protein [Seonamhaeicola maritimus]|uniref:MopE-related protein n=1 Tax=Seonamhaeicola maritimus TaxID=2591822 RepID=UPI00249447DD|nr:MopE-related protein [Seonamhaeicola maritimus]